MTSLSKLLGRWWEPSSREKSSRGIVSTAQNIIGPQAPSGGASLDVASLENRLLFSASPLAEMLLSGESDADMASAFDDNTSDLLNDFDDQFRAFAAADVESQESQELHAKLLPVMPLAWSENLPEDVVFAISGQLEFTAAGEHLEIAHTDALELDEGTIELTFETDAVWGRSTLLSKDAYGNGDGGHLTVFVNDGRVEARLQSETETVWIKSGTDVVRSGEQNHLALTFGSDGLRLYLNGHLEAWRSDFTQGLQDNTSDLLIGANSWGRASWDPDFAIDKFTGSIGNPTFYSRQYDDAAVAALAGIEFEASMDFEPSRTNRTVVGTDADEHIHGNNVNGGYGNDVVIGTVGDDVLDGGHGEDRLEGGAGNDLLISRSDGREARIAQNYDSSDDPNNEVNRRTRTIYPDQPIEADDVLIGGSGADTFRFEVLINAKEDIILDHVMNNGMIHWHGVAGENRNVHDHWVDRIGNDVIWDFNRAEGDRIEVAGHTVDVFKIEHVDTNNNGILDASVLYLQSNQGNAGAHNKDQLGTITVFGDLVTESDFTVNSSSAYGIIDNINDLDEALAPRKGTPVERDGAPPPSPDIDDGTLPSGAVFGMLNQIDLNGDDGDYLEFEHHAGLALSQGTIALTFSADNVFEYKTLFSKDADGYGDGGHITASVNDGRVEVRLQSATESVWLASNHGSVLNGEQHHVSVTFGNDGFWLYLDGKMADWKTDFTQGLQRNSEDLLIGANGSGRSPDHPDSAWNEFDGRISDFMIFDSQFTRNDVAVLSGNPPPAPLAVATVIDGVLQGSDADERGSSKLIAADFGVTNIHGGYGDDTLIGSASNDVLDGGHGEDRLYGGAGDDVLISRSDGREAEIAQNYNVLEDDPNREIDPNSRTYYSNQPIESDDIMTGGAGADTFRFEVLINAKPDIILKHVMDNGMIHWHGVAGENRNVHDHWVDRLGNEVIQDFSRAEGDTIEVVGHTVDVYKIEHQDSDGDGILDSTVLYVQSNQGNAGAHNKDQLGTITVFGDLVVASDVFVDSAPAMGIVNTIYELDEAISPRIGTPANGVMPSMPDPHDGELPPNAVFGVNMPIELTGEHGDHIEVAHDSDMELSNGTIALTFNTDNIWGRHALFSKDFTDNRDGGDLTAYLEHGRIIVRLQSASESVWLSTPEGSIAEGMDYHLAVTFGADGFWLYLNGQMADWDADFTQGLEHNTQNLAIGASTWSRTADRPDQTWDNFGGTIKTFLIFDRQFTRQQIVTLV